MLLLLLYPYVRRAYLDYCSRRARDVGYYHYTHQSKPCQHSALGARAVGCARGSAQVDRARPDTTSQRAERGPNTMPPSTGAPACALTKWPSAASALLWHACTPPAEAPASLDAQLALIRPKLSRDESYKLGKLSRSTVHLLFDELRYASGSASLEASWDVLSCALRYAYGQRREDLFLLPLLLNALRSEPTGRAQTFVELGALDGMSMSNTYMLERCLSWRGLLVEANPANYAKLAASPRNVTKRHAAVCAGDGSAGATVRMSIAGDNYAAMADLVDTKRKRHVGDGVVEVGCRSLTQLMREAGLHHGATFLSLDVSRKEFRTARASHTSAASLEIYCVTRPRAHVRGQRSGQ